MASLRERQKAKEGLPPPDPNPRGGAPARQNQATAARWAAAIKAGHRPQDFGYDENMNRTAAYTGKKLVNVGSASSNSKPDMSAAEAARRRVEAQTNDALSRQGKPLTGTGITSSNQAGDPSKVGAPPATGSNSFAPPVPTTNADGFVSVPPVAGSSSGTTTPALDPNRPGKINGQDASVVLKQGRGKAIAGGPGGEFGRSIAERNLGPEVTNDSFRTALADYNRRAAADDPIAREGRRDAYVAMTTKPGGVPDPSAVGPLQAALLRSRADRAARETREAEAFKGDFAATTNSVVAIDTSPLKKARESRLFGQRDNSGLPVPPPAAPKPAPTREPAAPWEKPNGVSWPESAESDAAAIAGRSREPAAPWEKPNGVTWSDTPSTPAVKESSLERSYGARTTPVKGGFTDTIPGAALTAAGRGVGDAATALYKAWRDQKPYDKKKGTSSIERSLATSARR